MSFLQDFLDLPKCLMPYLFHPLTAAEIFLPNSQFTSWISATNSFNPATDVPLLKGKVVLVTGGNAGLGQETIYQLATRQPDTIYLSARSESKSQAAIAEIKHRLVQNGSKYIPAIHWLRLDLSEFSTVQRAAEELLRREERLDVLVLNAGVMASPPSRTSSGHDLQLATNHMGHFLLVELLMPLLRQTAKTLTDSYVCVVTVSSEAYHVAGSDLLECIEDHDKLCAASNFKRYGVSKAANVLFASELARHCGKLNIRSVSLHPGMVMTGLYSPSKSSNPFLRYGLAPISQLVFDDLAHGALNTLWCVSAALRGQIENGQYYTPVGKIRDNVLTKDEDSATRLWTWTERQLTDCTVMQD